MGFEAVIIQNDAVGGTNTEIGTLRLKYNLLPKDMPKPDIIFNGYSTNDMHVLSMQRADAMNITLKEAVWDLTQNFIRAFEEFRGCGDDDPNDDYQPLLIYLDDYLGNEQNEILDTMAIGTTIELLSKYYQIMSISYADSVRHITYADTKETWFSPDWYDDKGYKREVHPFMGGHVSMMYVIAFNMLNALTVFCNEEAAIRSRDSFVQPIMMTELGDRTYLYRGAEGMPDIDLEKPISKFPSTILPSGIIPELNPELCINEISSMWEESTSVRASTCGAKKNGEKCNFAWLASIAEMDTVEKLTSKMNETIISNNGWEALAENDKLGFVPIKNDKNPNPDFVMEFKNMSRPIRSINFLALKSYGERWMDSRVNVKIIRISGSVEEIIEKEIEGSHSSETSVSYTYNYEINTEPGDDLKIHIELVSGSTFKFTGMAFCYY